MTFRSCRPQLKWITSHWESPSHSSIFFRPLAVSAPFSGIRWTFALPASSLPDRDGVADRNRIADQQHARQPRLVDHRSERRALRTEVVGPGRSTDNAAARSIAKRIIFGFYNAGVRRKEAVLRGMRFILPNSLEADNFEYWGGDYLWCFHSIASTSADTEVCALAREMGSHSPANGTPRNLAAPRSRMPAKRPITSP